MIKKGLSRLVIFFLYLVSLLPFWILYLLSDLLYLIIFYIVGYRRKVVQDNLRNSFPGKTVEELNTIERNFYKYFADLIVETVKMISISADEVRRRMIPTNPELVTKYYGQQKHLIGAVAHYGNWELAAHSFGLINEYKKVIVYKPLSNKSADSFYKQVRERFGSILVPMKATLRKLVELKNDLTFTVLVSDQTPVQHEAHYYTTFLNQPTAVFLGVEKIALMLDAAVVFCYVRRIKRGYYEYTLLPITTNSKQTSQYEITELHVRELEKMILNEPQYWLWSHRRWKFKPEDAFK